MPWVGQGAGPEGLNKAHNRLGPTLPVWEMRPLHAQLHLLLAPAWRGPGDWHLLELLPKHSSQSTAPRVSQMGRPPGKKTFGNSKRRGGWGGGGGVAQPGTGLLPASHSQLQKQLCWLLQPLSQHWAPWQLVVDSTHNVLQLCLRGLSRGQAPPGLSALLPALLCPTAATGQSLDRHCPGWALSVCRGWRDGERCLNKGI